MPLLPTATPAFHTAGCNGLLFAPLPRRAPSKTLAGDPFAQGVGSSANTRFDMNQFDSWVSPAQLSAIEATSTSSFTSVKFMTADDKQKVLTHWRKLMNWLASNGVPHEMPKAFTKVIYDHLQLHAFGYIAHYDIRGYWDAQLGSPEAAIAFFNELEEHLLCRWGALKDYADVNEAMMAAAREVRPAILRRLAQDDQAAARAAIAALAMRAGFAPGTDAAAVTTMAVARRKASTAAVPAPALATQALTTAAPLATISQAQAALF